MQEKSYFGTLLTEQKLLAIIVEAHILLAEIRGLKPDQYFFLRRSLTSSLGDVIPMSYQLYIPMRCSPTKILWISASSWTKTAVHEEEKTGTYRLSFARTPQILSEES